MADVRTNATSEVTLYDENGGQVGVAANPLVSRLAPSSDIVGFVSPSVAKKVGEGKFFVAGASIAVPALDPAGASFRLTNPAGSGVNLYVVKLTIYSNVEQQIRYRVNATMSGAKVITPRNLLVGPALPPAKFVADYSSTPPTDGELWSNESRVFANDQLEVVLPPLIITPGTSFTCYGSATGTQTTTVNAHLYQE